MKQVKIGLLGFGTVGSGVYRLLQKNGKAIAEKTGMVPVIEKILVRDKRKKREVEVNPELLTENPSEILDNPEIDIVCELIGGIEPAKSFVIQALKQGKEVVTANKAILAQFGEEIWEVATNTHRFLGFEAAVAGGIPIVKTIKEALIGNRIVSIIGILNGTTNYILTKMEEEGLSFEKALKEAQEKGYAEADPTLDINGMDSAHKISILASLAFGSYLPISKIKVEGIEKIELMDIKFAKEFGYRVKLLAFAIKDNDEVDIRVHPTLIPLDHVLSSIRLSYNALFLQGDFVGDILLYGLGAGREPTASAVVSDIVDAMEYRLFNKRPFIKYPFTNKKFSCKIKPMEQVKFKYYFRFSAIDKPGVLSRISGILGKHQISISSVVQMGRQKRGGSVPIVMLTHETKEKNVKSALKELDELEVVTDPTKVLRIME